MKTILQILRNTDQPMLSYVWRAWLIILLPVVVMTTAKSLLELPGPDVESSSLLNSDQSLRWSFLVPAGFVCPWVETLLMWPILWTLKRVMGNQKIFGIALVSAVIFGCLHGLSGISWGLTATWGFFVFSLCFLEWEKKSRYAAILVTGSVHTVNNLGVVLVILLVYYFLL